MSSAIVVAGEAVVDLIGARDDTFRAVAGGSPLNVAVAAARLGTSTYFAGRFACDRFGTMLRAHADGNGVDLSLAVDVATSATALAVANLDEYGSAEWMFYLDAAPDWHWDVESLPELPADVAIMHTGSLVTMLEPAASAVLAYCEQLRESGRALVSYDANVRPAIVPDRDEAAKRVERFVAAAHIAKASADDLAWLWPGRTPTHVAAGWLSAGVDCVVITHGADGATVVTSGGTLHVPSVRVAVVDTVGAGDAFTAGFLSALAAHDDVVAAWHDMCTAPPDIAFGQAASRAAVTGALTCARAGALGPTVDEVNELLRPAPRHRTDEPLPSAT